MTVLAFAFQVNFLFSNALNT